MHPTSHTCWIAVLIVLLAVVAFILDDASIYLVAGLLALFLGVRYVVFISAFRSCIESLFIDRSVSHVFARRGSTITVQTQIAISSAETLSIICRDLIPAGSVLESGTDTLCIDPGATPEARTTYGLKMLAIGDHAFGGLSIRGEDFFYSATTRYTLSRAQMPTIHIFPSSLPVLPRDLPGLGEGESTHRPLLHGQSTLQLRPYVENDDMRRIDWKSSAHHNRLIVRELSTITDDSVFIVVDLPDRNHGNEETVRGVFNAVGGRIEIELERKHYLSLLVLSGGDIILFLPHMMSREEIQEATLDFRQVERTHHLYRVLDDQTAFQHYQAAERLHSTLRREQDLTAFSGSLSRIYRAFLDGPEPVVLNNRLFQIFEETACQAVDLYSTCDGDISHIRAVCRQAEQREMKIRLHVPGGSGVTETLLPRLPPSAEVEVL